MTEKKSPVISFKDFSFQYRAQKKPTLTGINLDIYPGEKVLIAGRFRQWQEYTGRMCQRAESFFQSGRMQRFTDCGWCGCAAQQYF